MGSGISRIHSRAAATFARMVGDSRGVAAIEFALILPIMFMLLVGTVEFSLALTVDRRVSQVANSTADLIAQKKKFSTSEVSGIMQIIEHLVRPYDPSRLRVTVLNVIANISDASDTTVCWSYEHNGGAGSYSAGAEYFLPEDIVEAGGSVIVAEVVYDYEPIIFRHFIKSAFSLSDTLYLKPRLSSYVEYNGQSCS